MSRTLAAFRLQRMSRDSEYTTRQPVTACHAASSWHTIRIAEVSRNDDARPYASAQELAQMEPCPRVPGVCHLLHPRLSPRYGRRCGVDRHGGDRRRAADQ